MTTKDELRDLASDFACDLAQACSVDDWHTWLIFLAECLESEAFERKLDAEHPAGVELALERLRDALSDRLTNRRW